MWQLHVCGLKKIYINIFKDGLKMVSDVKIDVNYMFMIIIMELDKWHFETCTDLFKSST